MTLDFPQRVDGGEMGVAMQEFSVLTLDFAPLAVGRLYMLTCAADYGAKGEIFGNSPVVHSNII